MSTTYCQKIDNYVTHPITEKKKQKKEKEKKKRKNNQLQVQKSIDS